MKKLIAFLAVVTPATAMAQNLAPVTDVNSLSSKLLGIGNTLTYLLVALAVIFIVWNIVFYVIKSGSPEERGKHGMNIVWGIVGLFVIVSIWGLVNILTNTFKTTPTNQPIPNVGQITNTGGIPASQIPQVQ